jgi:hypothetical protein
VALGVTLALRYLRGGRLPVVGVVHGLVGAAGLGLLVAALQGPRRGVAMGVGSFGVVAAVLFGMALTLGLFIPLTVKGSPRVAGVVLAIHATVAITGFVLFLAWVSM